MLDLEKQRIERQKINEIEHQKYINELDQKHNLKMEQIKDEAERIKKNNDDQMKLTDEKIKEDLEKMKQDSEFKEEVENVEKQALNLINIATDKDKYKGIIGN